MPVFTNLSKLFSQSSDYIAYHYHYADNEQSDCHDRRQMPAEDANNSRLALIMDEISENLSFNQQLLHPGLKEQAGLLLNETALLALENFRQSFDGAGCLRKKWQNSMGGTSVFEVFPASKGP